MSTSYFEWEELSQGVRADHFRIANRIAQRQQDVPKSFLIFVHLTGTSMAASSRPERGAHIPP